MPYSIRKLQQTGGKSGSSFLVILPKEWIRRQKLSKGDPVVIIEREDGSLIVDPRLPKAGESRNTIVKIESNLRWTITSKYLLGFDEIQVVSDKPISNDQRDELKRIIKRFVALEVTDEDDNQIVVQCLVDPTTLPVHKAMRRMNLIASRMLNDAFAAYFDGLQEVAESVVARDEEVDRLFFLIVRELRLAIQYPRMSEGMGITPVKALDFRLAAQYIERIADLAVDIANRTLRALDKKLAKKMEPIVKMVKEMQSNAVTSLFKFDSEKVAWVIKAEKEIIEDTAKLRQYLISTPNDEPQTHLYVADILLRIGEAAKDIADLGLPES
ncbi:MAG: PhoU domain-containing protein [Candidatus Thorarchaeota archaeon]